MKFLRKSMCFILFFICSYSAFGADAIRKEHILDAISYYQQHNFPKAAEIFQHIVNKSVPIADPFCRSLASKGYPITITELPAVEGNSEMKKATAWFRAAEHFSSLTSFSLKSIERSTLVAQNMHDGPMLYLIGSLHERGVAPLKIDINKAKELFSLAFKWGDPRGILGLSRVEPETPIWGFKASSISKIIYHHLSHGKGEAAAFAHLSKSKDCRPEFKTYFLYLAAQFGHGDSQFEWGKSHCANEAESLFWMIQSAEQNNGEALSLVGHLLEQGEGTPRDYPRAFDYIRRAAAHPSATITEYLNLAHMYEFGKGTPPDVQQACFWCQRAYEAYPTDPQSASDYGRTLSLVGRYSDATRVLAPVRTFSVETAYNYLVSVYFASETRGVSEEFVSDLTALATKGHLESACLLETLLWEGKITYDVQSLKVLIERAIPNTTNRQIRAQGYITLYYLSEKFKELSQTRGVDRLDLIRNALDCDPGDAEIVLRYAKELRQVGRFQEALKSFLSLPESYGGRCYNEIGACHSMLATEESNAKLSKKHDQEALVYFLKQMKEGPSPDAVLASYNIFSLYNKGRVEPRIPDPELLAYLKFAVDGEDEDALLDLGAGYYLGLYGLTVDHDQAEDLYMRASKKGKMGAKVNLMNLWAEKGETEKAKSVFSELWDEHLLYFKEYINTLMTEVERIMATPEGEGGSRTTEAQLIESRRESEAQEAPVSASIMEPEEQLSLGGEEESAKYDDEEDILNAAKASAAPMLRSEQPPVLPKLSHKERAIAEEKERQLKKYERLMRNVEDLKGKKQEKYRKVRALIDQHIQVFGGAIKNAKGSGRRMRLGDKHTGFHQPHGANMKAGVLENISRVMGDATLVKGEK